MRYSIKFTFLIFLFQIVSFQVFAQFREAHPETKKYALLERGGYLVTDYIFDELDRRSDTTFFAKKGELCGLINEKGETRIPFEYEAIELFLSPFSWQNGLAAVSKNKQKDGTWGMVDLEGEVVLPLKYDYVRSIFPDLIVAREFTDTMLQFFDGEGKPLFTTPGRSVTKGFDEKSIRINRHKQPDFFADKMGQPIFPDRFESPVWTDGKFVINIKDRKHGVTDWSGKVIIPFEWERIKPVGASLFIVQENGYHLGLMNGKGETILPASPCELYQFGTEPGNVIIRKIEGQRYSDEIYDTKGKKLDVLVGFATLIDMDRQLPRRPDSEPRRYLKIETKDGVRQINKGDGTPIIGPISGGAKYYSEAHPILINLVGEGGKNLGSYATDLNGKIILPNGKYTHLSHTVDPKVLWASTEDKRSGFVHLDRPEEAKIIYKNTSRMANDFWRAGLKNEYYLLSPTGQLLSKKGFARMDVPNKDQVRIFQKDERTNGRLRAVAKVKGMGYEEWIALNENGEAFYFSNDAIIFEEVEEEFIDQPVEEEMEIVMEEVDVPYQEEKVAASKSNNPNRYSEFPGGDEAINKFIYDNLKYPKEAKEKGIQGEVHIYFKVDIDGSIFNAIIAKDIGGGCSEEALRIVNAMPNWEPGMTGGTPTITSQMVRVKFELEEKD